MQARLLLAVGRWAPHKHACTHIHNTYAHTFWMGVAQAHRRARAHTHTPSAVGVTKTQQVRMHGVRDNSPHLKPQIKNPNPAGRNNVLPTFWQKDMKDDTS